MDDNESSSIDKLRCSCDRRENEQAVKKTRKQARRRVSIVNFYDVTFKGNSLFLWFFVKMNG
jgi:hypothetical protein